jgi:hypothetical protein
MTCALIGLAMTGHGGAEPAWYARPHGAAAQALADLGGTVEPPAAPSTRRRSWRSSGPRTQQGEPRVLAKVRLRRS